MLKEHYLQYFKTFRDVAPKHMVLWGGYITGLPTGMASSLESCLEFSKLVHDPDALILNAGAGASSFVLRKLFPNVICTDPNEEYLEVVKYICGISGLSTDNFKVGQIPKCDYCYYDYGNIERIPNFLKAVDRTKYKLYADDCDTRPECKEYRDYVYSLGLNVTDCVAAKDEYGRWGVIVTK